MNSALPRTSSIASRMRGSNGAYCALTSTSGIGRTAEESRGQIDQAEGDGGDHGVIEVLADAVVVRANRPADGRQAETEDRAPDRRQHDETGQRHAPDSGWYGDERADARGHEADRDGDPAEAVEPAPSAIEPGGRDMEEPAASLEPLLGVHPERPATDRTDEVAEQPGERHHDVRGTVRLDLVAEEGDLGVRECTR